MQPMYPEFNAMVQHAVNVLLPKGYDVTDNASECDTLKKLERYYYATGRIMVWSGESEHTIFGHAHMNHAFRAWHDFVHTVFGLPFTTEGEHLVMKIQQRQVHTLGTQFTIKQQTLFCKLLECEIDGQVAFYNKHGEFVKDQRAFAQKWMVA